MRQELYVTNRHDWRSWLKKSHAMVKEVWLIYYKKHTGKPRIPYDDAVEEALCFGWIDSTVRKIDEERFAQKFTPRRAKSNWSELNKARAEKLMKQGRMTKAGLARIETAKTNGEWNKTTTPGVNYEFPAELKEALSVSIKAREFYDSLSASSRKQFIGWIASAKKKETRQKRAEEAVKLLKRKQKLGMK